MLQSFLNSLMEQYMDLDIVVQILFLGTIKYTPY